MTPHISDQITLNFQGKLNAQSIRLQNSSVPNNCFTSWCAEYPEAGISSLASINVQSSSFISPHVRSSSPSASPLVPAGPVSPVAPTFRSSWEYANSCSSGSSIAPEDPFLFQKQLGHVGNTDSLSAFRIELTGLGKDCRADCDSSTSSERSEILVLRMSVMGITQ